MAYGQSWDETTPVGASDAGDLDTDIQNTKVAIRERLEDVIDDFANDAVDPKQLNLGPICKVTLTSALAVADSTDTTIDWTSEVFDDDAVHDSGDPSYLTIPVDGKYLIGVNIAWQTNGTGNRIVNLESSAASGMVALSTIGAITVGLGASAVGQNLVYLADAAANDTFHVIVWQTSGGSLNVLTQSCFWLHRLDY